MARLRGLGSFLLVTVAVLLALRLLHVAVAALFPEVRPGPVIVRSLADVERRAGFAPLVPAYRPAALGARPAAITVTIGPAPGVVIVWRGEQYLSITEQRGGPVPDHPPTARALGDVPDSLWWSDGTVHRVLVRRGELWVTVETDLPSRDLRRIADTLRPY